jgi:glutamate synthase (NADPH/NADH) small chain
MGFADPGPNELVNELEITRDTSGFIARDGSGMTSTPGVFVAGDMAAGASLVVRAMDDAKRVATGIRAYLGDAD